MSRFKWKDFKRSKRWLKISPFLQRDSWTAWLAWLFKIRSGVSKKPLWQKIVLKSKKKVSLSNRWIIFTHFSSWDTFTPFCWVFLPTFVGTFYPLLLRHFYPLLLGHFLPHFVGSIFTPFCWVIFYPILLSQSLPPLVESFYPILLGHFTPFFWVILPIIFVESYLPLFAGSCFTLFCWILKS